MPRPLRARRTLLPVAAAVAAVGLAGAVVAVVDGEDELLVEPRCREATASRSGDVAPVRLVGVGTVRDAFGSSTVEVAAEDPRCLVVRDVLLPSQPDPCLPAVVSTLVVDADDEPPVLRAVAGRAEGARRVEDCEAISLADQLVADLAVALPVQVGDVVRLEGRGEVTVSASTGADLVRREAG